MTDVRRLAIRFADLWAISHHQMVEEIYARDIYLESMADPGRFIRGRTQLHELEDELALRIPEHRHELVRVLGAEQLACLETTVVAPLTHEYAPACLFWRLNHAGQVAAEVTWFDWNARTSDARLCHGTVPPDDGRTRGGPKWYESFAHRFAHLWMTDPLLMVEELFASNCSVTSVGRSELHGIDALKNAEQALLDRLPIPGRTMEIHRVVGEGAVLAMLMSLGDSARVCRAAVVLTLDADDRVISDRGYLDWQTARPRDHTTGVSPDSLAWNPR